MTVPAKSLPAGLWRRFMAASYEGVILFGVAVFFGYAFSALTQYQGETGAMRHVFQAYLFLVFGVYLVWFWSDGRRSLPMKTVMVRLVDAAGRAPGKKQAALRYVLAWLFLAIPVALASTWGPAALCLMPVSWVWALFDPAKRTAYDRLAGTRLVVDEQTRP